MTKTASIKSKCYDLMSKHYGEHSADIRYHFSRFRANPVKMLEFLEKLDKKG